jgi:hypothetical protein
VLASQVNLDNQSITLKANAIAAGAYYLVVEKSPSESLSEKNYFVTASFNAQPTDIALSSTSVAERLTSGTIVGTFSTTDPDADDSFTYTLSSGTGGADNGSFTIAGSVLKTAVVLNFETKSSYSIRVRSTDLGGLFVEMTFAITVTDVNETPTDITVTSTSVPRTGMSTTRWAPSAPRTPRVARLSTRWLRATATRTTPRSTS